MQLSYVKIIIRNRDTFVLIPKSAKNIANAYGLDQECDQIYFYDADLKEAKRLYSFLSAELHSSKVHRNDYDCDPKSIMKIQSLHLIDYPYFWQAYISGHLSYSDIIKLLYVQCEGYSPKRPTLSTALVGHSLKQFMKDLVVESKPIAIICPVNFSHRSLGLYKYEAIIQSLSCRYNILVNLSQASSDYIEFFSEVSNRYTELKIVMLNEVELIYASSCCSLAIGVHGGAMDVISNLSDCDQVLIFGTELINKEIALFMQNRVSNSLPSLEECPLTLGLSDNFWTHTINDVTRKRVWGPRESDLTISRINDILRQYN